MRRGPASGQLALPMDGNRLLELRDDEPLAIELTSALKIGNVARLTELLALHPHLAAAVVLTTEGAGRTPLHLFADAPGLRPNAAAVVQSLVAAGADVNAPAIGMWHTETPLHWAASNDDLELIDALLDAGADIEAPGASLGGGPPLADAVGYGMLAAARRLVERGATVDVWNAAAMGMLPLLERLLDAEPRPSENDINIAFWGACAEGERAAAALLLERGAHLDWPAPWSGETPLDVALNSHQSVVVTWLRGLGATAHRVH